MAWRRTDILSEAGTVLGCEGEGAAEFLVDLLLGKAIACVIMAYGPLVP